jgi:DNA segregation ATPase FtsK/SpoIIIE-like protein
LLQLANDAATGCLQILDAGDDEALVFLKSGLIYSVAVPGTRPQLGAKLVSSGAIAPEALADALQAQRTELQGWRLGELLVHLGYVEQPVVEAFIREQVRDALWDLLLWPGETWKFRKNVKAREDVGPPLAVVDLLETLRDRGYEWETISAVLHGPTAVPRLSTRGDSDPETVLDNDAWSMLCKIDGERSVGDLARDCGYTMFEAGQVIVALVQAGLVDIDEDVDLAGSAPYGASTLTSALAGGIIDIHDTVDDDEADDADDALSRLARLVSEVAGEHLNGEAGSAHDADPDGTVGAPQPVRSGSYDGSMTVRIPVGSEESFALSIARVSSALSEVLGDQAPTMDPAIGVRAPRPRPVSIDDPEWERRQRLRAAAAAELATAQAMIESLRDGHDPSEPTIELTDEVPKVVSAEIERERVAAREAEEAERRAAEEATRLAAEQFARAAAEEAERVAAEQAERDATERAELEAAERAELEAAERAELEAAEQAELEAAERAEAERAEAEAAERAEAEQAEAERAELETQAWAEYWEREEAERQAAEQAAAEEAARLAAEAEAAAAEETERLAAQEAARLAAEAEAAEEVARLAVEAEAEAAAAAEAEGVAAEAAERLAAEAAAAAAAEAEVAAAAEAERVAAEEAARHAAAEQAEEAEQAAAEEAARLAADAARQAEEAEATAAADAEAERVAAEKAAVRAAAKAERAAQRKAQKLAAEEAARHADHAAATALLVELAMEVEPAATPATAEPDSTDAADTADSTDTTGRAGPSDAGTDSGTDTDTDTDTDGTEESAGQNGSGRALSDAETTDTAALLRELSSLGIEEERRPVDPTPPRAPRPTATPEKKPKKKIGLFGR